jgi:hypothetical protein
MIALHRALPGSGGGVFPPPERGVGVMLTPFAFMVMGGEISCHDNKRGATWTGFLSIFPTSPTKFWPNAMPLRYKKAGGIRSRMIDF